jgi:hypothetical protein
MNRSSDGFYPAADESSTLSVCPGAIFAGAAAAALSLILVLLGFGLDFRRFRPGPMRG